MTDFVVLTGFLGSGKTTLLRDFLTGPEAADTAVMVNEAGEIGLDGVILNEGNDTPIAMLATRMLNGGTSMRAIRMVDQVTPQPRLSSTRIASSSRSLPGVLDTFRRTRRERRGPAGATRPRRRPPGPPTRMPDPSTPAAVLAIRLLPQAGTNAR